MQELEGELEMRVKNVQTRSAQLLSQVSPHGSPSLSWEALQKCSARALAAMQVTGKAPISSQSRAKCSWQYSLVAGLCSERQ